MEQFSIAAFGHPFGSRQMIGMKTTALFSFEIRVQSEQDLHNLAPIGSVPIRVKEPQIKRHVLAIIGRKPLALRRFIQEWRWRALHQRRPYCLSAFLDAKYAALIDPRQLSPEIREVSPN